MRKSLQAVAVSAVFAALSGAAFADSGFVTSRYDGSIVRSGFGECVRAGMAGPASAACPAMTAQTEMMQPRQPMRMARAEQAAPETPEGAGYVTSRYGAAVRSGFGLCWHSGFWTPDMATMECDPSYVPKPVAVAPAPPPPAPVVVAPPPPPPVVAAPPPPPPVAVAPAAPRQLIQKLAIEFDVLFAFATSELRPAGRERLDALADNLKGANISEITAIGYADRIGPRPFNEKLSEERAAAVRNYLASKGISEDKLKVQGRGEADPVTGDACRGLRDAKLIACLAPDRRVEIEVLGERTITQR